MKEQRNGGGFDDGQVMEASREGYSQMDLLKQTLKQLVFGSFYLKGSTVEEQEILKFSQSYTLKSIK